MAFSYEGKVVIDTGTSNIKAGHSYENEPRLVFPTVLGTKSYGSQSKKLIGLEALNPEYTRQPPIKYQLSYPIRRGHVTDFTSMECLWQHTFDSLGIDTPQMYSALLSKRYSGFEGHKEISQIFFEQLQFGSLYIGIPAVLALWATNKTSGMVVDVGAGYTHVAPVVDSYPIFSAIKYLDVGGLDIDRALLDFLDPSGFNDSISHTLQEIKLSSCYVSLNKVQDLKASKHSHYTLPDGKKISLARGEAFYAPEILFAPEMLGNDLNKSGLQGIVFDSINTCSIENRRVMYENIIMTGGTSRVRQIDERLKYELEKLYKPQSTLPKVRVDAKLSPHLAWLGGAALAELSSYGDLCVSRQEYDEFGYRVLKNKFITGEQESRSVKSVAARAMAFGGSSNNRDPTPARDSRSFY